MRRLAVVALALALGTASAYAGGNFMDVAAGPRTVWVTGDFGVARLDARTGRTSSRIVLSQLYALGVGVGGGAAWVASVENGFGGGTVTRIDLRTGARRTIFRRAGWAPQQVAFGRSVVWVLFGSRRSFRLGRFDFRGRLLGVTPLGRDAGWLTADARGAWACCRGLTLLRVDPKGRAHPAFELPVDNPVWAVAGSIWLAGFGVLERLDERTGRILARIALASPQDVAFGAGSVYALGAGSLVRIDPSTSRVLVRRRIPGITQAVSAAAGGVWVTSVARPSRSRVFRLDPKTLAVELRLALP